MTPDQYNNLDYVTFATHATATSTPKHRPDHSTVEETDHSNTAAADRSRRSVLPKLQFYKLTAPVTNKALKNQHKC